METINILGISGLYHDSAAALLCSWRILAAVQEERFTQKKHDSRMPIHSIAYCLREAKLSVDQLDYAVFYEKPLQKFDRILETWLTYSPRGFRQFLMGPIIPKPKATSSLVSTKNQQRITFINFSSEPLRS